MPKIAVASPLKLDPSCEGIQGYQGFRMWFCPWWLSHLCNMGTQEAWQGAATKSRWQTRCRRAQHREGQELTLTDK